MVNVANYSLFNCTGRCPLKLSGRRSILPVPVFLKLAMGNLALSENQTVTVGNLNKPN